ncbi:hypothetical protein Tco_0537108 [Tanacetum coccineum]
MNTIQDIKMQMVDDNVRNQVRQNAVQNDGNEVEQKAFQNPSIQNVENMNELSVVSEIANHQSTTSYYDDLQHATTSRTQSDMAPDYDFRWNNRAQLGDLKGKSSDTQCASNTLDPLSQKLEDENVSLEFQVLCYAKENAHLKTTYKNLFDSIKMLQVQTNSIIDSLQKQLYDTIYENAKLRAQLFDKVSKTKGTIIVTANHDVCMLNYVNDMNSRADNQSANVSKRENQKKHKANAKKSKELGSKGSLASSRPSKPRTCLRWILTGRIFAMCGKLTA